MEIMGTATPALLLLFLVLAGAVLFLALRSEGQEFGKGAALLLPAGAPPHGHRAVLTPEGSGVSTCSEGHRHVITEGRDAGPVPCRPAAGQKTAAHRHAVERRGGAS